MAIFNLFPGKKENRSFDKDPITLSDLEEDRTAFGTFGLGFDTIPEVIACMNIRANALASLPLDIYKISKDGYKEKAIDHPLHKILTRQPTKAMYEDINTFIRRMVYAYDRHGNFYAQIVRDVSGRVTELIPLDSGAVQVQLVRDINGNDALLYRYSYAPYGQLTTTTLEFRADQILHIKMVGPDTTLTGKGIIERANATMKSVSMLNEVAYNINANLIQPSVVIETPEKMSKDDFLQLKELLKWHKKQKGREMILSGGAKKADNQNTVTAENAQFIQTLNYRTSQIANLFGVPLYKLNVTSDRKPNASIVQENLDFYNNTIKAIVDAFEAAMNQRLLTEDEKDEYIIAFDTSELNDEGTVKADFYAKTVVNGIMTREEVRKQLGLPYIEGSEKLLIPQNQAVPQENLTKQPNTQDAQTGNTNE